MGIYPIDGLTRSEAVNIPRQYPPLFQSNNFKYRYLYPEIPFYYSLLSSLIEHHLRCETKVLNRHLIDEHLSY
jgi:hypothetical protein